MKQSEKSYSIMIFRGARDNPLRLTVRKSIVRFSIIAGCCLLLIQGGIIAHYLIQKSQLTELEGLRTELSNSRERTSDFAGEIDTMKKRMVSLESLNRKLQNLFGLEANAIEGSKDIKPGQGGVDLPFEDSASRDEGAIGHSSSIDGLEFKAQFSDYNKSITEVSDGIRWLTSHATIEEEVLQELSETASKKAEQWASTPSIWPVKGAITSKFGPRISPFTGKKSSSCWTRYWSTQGHQNFGSGGWKSGGGCL